MEQEKSNSKLKAIIIVLALLLIGSLGYLFKITTDNQTLESTVDKVKIEKETFLSELNELKKSYDLALDEKTTLSEELELERQKVIDLMNQVEKAQNDSKVLAALRTKFKSLEGKNKILITENERLAFENQQLKTNLEETKNILSSEKVINASLSEKNVELSDNIKEAAKLSLLNLKTDAYEFVKRGKESKTNLARRVQLLKISFDIPENKLAKPGDYKFYIQIIDPNSNVIGAREEVVIDGKKLGYSLVSKVQFKNSTLQVVENLNTDNFESGTYFINVYDENTLVAKSSFDLK